MFLQVQSFNPLVANIFYFNLFMFNLFAFIRGTLSFNLCQDLKNPWNENKPVKIGRDGQVSKLSSAKSLSTLALFNAH